MMSVRWRFGTLKKRDKARERGGGTGVVEVAGMAGLGVRASIRRRHAVGNERSVMAALQLSDGGLDTMNGRTARYY